MSEETLYSKLGSEPAIEATAELLTQKLSKDSLLSDYFVNIDLKSHKLYLKKFLTKFTGGPDKYNGRDLREAHQDLEIKDEEFTHLLSLIKDTLNELGVSQDLISIFCGAAETLRNEILNK